MTHLLISLALLLPSAILATPLYSRDLPWNSTNSSVPILADHGDEHRGDNHQGKTGDTLGVTRCYCASKDWVNDNKFGYYYLWDYYNFHANSRILLERSCAQSDWTRNGILGSVNYQLKCLRPKTGEQDCMKDWSGNKFCYHYWGKEKFDKFSWNGQLRGLPLNSKAAKHPSVAEQYDRCEYLCHYKVGNDNGEMEILHGRSMVYAEHKTPPQDRFHEGDNEWSHIAYYPEVDDMCHGCK